MTSTPRRIDQIGLLRWKIALWAAITLCAALVLGIGPGLVRQAWSTAGKLRQDSRLVKGSLTFPARIAALTRDNTALDSLIKSNENRRVFDQSTVLRSVYDLAARTGCATSRVELGEKVVIEQGSELPIMITGQAAYASIGRFVEGIENMDLPTRVRQLHLKKTAGEAEAFEVDFVVLQ